MATEKLSIINEIEKIGALAVRWHKSELASWLNLFEKIKVQYASDAFDSWFYLYSMIRDYEGMEKEGESLIIKIRELIEEFMKTSTIGEYSGRLELLNQFYEYLKNESEFELRNLFINIINYYKIFEIHIKKRLDDELEPLKSDLKSFVKLTTWNDRTSHGIKYKNAITKKKLKSLCKNTLKTLRQPILKILIKLKEDGINIKNTQSVSQSSSQIFGEWESYCSQIRAEFNIQQICQNTKWASKLPENIDKMMTLLKREFKSNLYLSKL